MCAAFARGQAAERKEMMMIETVVYNSWYPLWEGNFQFGIKRMMLLYR